MSSYLAMEVDDLINSTILILKSVERFHSAPVKAENRSAASAEGLPHEFDEVGKHVPTVRGALEAISENISQQNDQTCTEMKDIAADCNRKTGCLKKLFSTVIPSNKKMESYRKAVHEIENKSRVEEFMKGVMQDVKLLLTIDGDMKLATEKHLQLLEEAIKEVSAIESSLQDESPSLGFYNYGPGPQNNNTGSGPQNNNNGEGIQITGGNFTGVDPFHRNSSKS